MSLALNPMGPNSASLLWDNETLPNLMTAINDWLVQHGWDLFDSVSATAKVYRAVNAGGTTYKYMRLEAISGYLDVKHYESWNATTHVGTNLAAGATTYPALTLTSGTLYLFASNRWFYATGKTGTTFDYGNGICEFSRDNPTDTEAGGFPASFFYNGAVLMLPAGAGPAICRNRQNLTAASANTDTAFISSLGVIKANGTNNRQQQGVSNFYHADTPIFFSQFTDSSAAFDYRGRVYGIKFLPIQFGAHLDVVSIKCDANGFASAAGTPVDHAIFAASTARFALPL